MKISHVIRAEEHLPNTPKQQLLWTALGYTPPVWAHVPVVVNEKRQKLRSGGTRWPPRRSAMRVTWPAAMRNYLMLARLGTQRRSGDRSVVGHRGGVPARAGQLLPAFFDEKKLRAFNGEYILGAVHRSTSSTPARRGSPARSAGSASPRGHPPTTTRQCSPLSRRWRRPGVAVLSEIVALVDFLFLTRQRDHDRRGGMEKATRRRWRGML